MTTFQHETCEEAQEQHVSNSDVGEQNIREQPEALALGQFVITCCLPLLQGLLKSSMYAMECHVHQNLMV
jgi:hypothetical protein